MRLNCLVCISGKMFADSHFPAVLPAFDGGSVVISSLDYEFNVIILYCPCHLLRPVRCLIGRGLKRLPVSLTHAYGYHSKTLG